LIKATLLKAIFEPSGDHAGNVSGTLLEVIFTGLLPSAFITKMSLLLKMNVWVKAMRAPSGDHDGWESLELLITLPVAPVGISHTDAATSESDP
jgi:hypothetical protein